MFVKIKVILFVFLAVFIVFNIHLSQADQVAYREGQISGFQFPRSKQGVNDIYDVPTPQQLDARYQRLDTDLQIGLKVYNLWWFSFENDGTLSSPSSTAVICQPGMTKVPANETERIAKGYHKYRCLYNGQIGMWDNYFARDAAHNIQSAVVLWSSPPKYRIAGCQGFQWAGGIMKDGCVPRDDAMDDFEDYVNFLADRYDGSDPAKGKIYHFIIWNEAASGGWFDYTPVIPRTLPLSSADIALWIDKYADMLRRAHSAIRRHSSSGVLPYASIDAIWQSNVTLNDFVPHIGSRQLLEGLWSRLGTTIDWGVAVHPYGDPTADAGPNWLNFAGLPKLATFQEDHLRALGFANPLNMPQSVLFASEQGWPGEDATTKARFICEAHNIVMQIPNMLGTTHNHFHTVSQEEQNSPDNSGLIPFSVLPTLENADGVPTWEAYRSTSPALWNRSSYHYCCVKHALGCGDVFFKMIDAQSGGFRYAYAPAIVKKDGVYHAFFCSQGEGPTWDYIRYSASTDGKTWSTPVIKLRATANIDPSTGKERNYAACDPSVVYYQGYYYLFYSNAYQTGSDWIIAQTVISVARSTQIDGTYLTYTERGTWEDNPLDPKMIIKPLVTRTTSPPGYGAGQQQVVVKDNKLLMWYDDDSIDLNHHTYMIESVDPVSWNVSSTREISVAGESMDIKYDPKRNGFVMVTIMGINQNAANAHLVASFSSDGLVWKPFTTIFSESEFPDYGHNVGMSADETGTRINEPILVGFGAPHDFSTTDTWGQWNLYGVFVNLTSSFPPPSCTSVGPRNVITTATTGTLDFYAYGVQNATSVSFPAWSVVNGQDDIGWYGGIDMGGGTWKGTVDLSRHRPGNPDYGPFSMHVWMFGPGGNVFCGAADFTRNVQGDLNGDGNVDIIDLSFITSHFGQTASHPQWNATADVIADNEIDIYDVIFVASRFG